MPNQPWLYCISCHTYLIVSRVSDLFRLSKKLMVINTFLSDKLNCILRRLAISLVSLLSSWTSICGKLSVLENFTGGIWRRIYWKRQKGEESSFLTKILKVCTSRAELLSRLGKGVCIFGKVWILQFLSLYFHNNPALRARICPFHFPDNFFHPLYCCLV